jgi:hypothetical protein
MSYHQVLPGFIEFILTFGSKSLPQDLRFSVFKSQIWIAQPTLNIPDMNRSGKEFHLCYNLKCVNRTVPHLKDIRQDIWSIRQAGIYHKFDIEYGTSLFILVKGDKELFQRYNKLVEARTQSGQLVSSIASTLQLSLDAHLVYCYWSTEDWRWYIRWIEDIIAKHVSYLIIYLLCN